MVIFGGGGDLTKRLVVPALYNLAKQDLLPERFAIIGIDRTRIRLPKAGARRLHDFLEQMIQSGDCEFEAKAIDPGILEKADRRDALHAEAISPSAELYAAIEEQARGHGRRKRELGGNVLFYLAVPDRFFGPIVDRLGEAGLARRRRRRGWRRVVVEKPFGHDLSLGARAECALLRSLDEEQIYRIDHFLGKETVQNIMAVRFANGLFEPIWNRDRIDHVQITVSEDIGVERRGNFYEKTGALRDMVPNHLFQLVAMTAMEPPSSFDADAVRSKKADVFRAARPIAPHDCAVRGQYGAGQGRRHGGARPIASEPDVAPDSPIETFVALKLTIDNWRWAGVPFYLRTGKRMPKRYTEIAIRFKHAPYTLFHETQQGSAGSRLAGAGNPAQRGHPPALQCQAAGRPYDPRRRVDEFPVFRMVQTGARRRLRDAALRLLHRRRHAVPARRPDRGILGRGRSAARGLGRDAGRPTFRTMPPAAPGPAAADELLDRDGRVWRPIG